MDNPSREDNITDFVVHLNCLSDALQYGNTSAHFRNTMKPSIFLPFHTPYEVGVSNIYFSENVYSILANDKDSAISVCMNKVVIFPKDQKENEGESNTDEISKEDTDYDDDVVEDEVKLDKNTLYIDKVSTYKTIEEKEIMKVYPTVNHANNIGGIIDDYNKQFGINLLAYDDLQSKILFDGSSKNFIELIRKSGLFPSWYNRAQIREGYTFYITLKFARRIGEYLGFLANKPIVVEVDYESDKPVHYSRLHEEFQEQYIINKVSGLGTSGLISNIFVYCNIVKQSRTGSQNTNLLEIVPVNAKSKKNSLTIYKEVSQYEIHYIEILLKDEFGGDIAFLDNTFVAIDLHFKPKS